MNRGSASGNELVHLAMTPFGLERTMIFRRISSNNTDSQNNPVQAMDAQRRIQIIGGGSAIVIIDKNNCSVLGGNQHNPIRPARESKSKIRQTLGI
jgi:hypothetical protein